MDAPLYMMIADYGIGTNDGHTIYANDLAALRIYGNDHHTAAQIKPTLTICHPNGVVISTMTEWDSSWQDAKGSDEAKA